VSRQVQLTYSVLFRFQQSDADFAYVGVVTLGVHAEPNEKIAGIRTHAEWPLQLFRWQIFVHLKQTPLVLRHLLTEIGEHFLEQIVPVFRHWAVQ